MANRTRESDLRNNKEVLDPFGLHDDEVKKEKVFVVPRPDEIKAYLDQYVIGQEEAKRTLSVAVYNHYKRVAYNKRNEIEYNPDNIDIDKSNIILEGATGSGKTFIIKTIAKMLNVPCYIQDSTKLTASGYVGGDVEDCLVGLLRTCDYDIPLAEMGIVVLDEGDKIARKSGANMSITRDVSGESVQQSLLKIVEGDIVGVPPAGGRRHPEQKLLYINTTNILFVLSGAFVGIESIIKKRMGGTRIGFNVENITNGDDDGLIKYTTPQDLREFGLIPELVGRFPVITHVNRLTAEDLKKILNEPKNAILKQYKHLLEMDGAELSFDDSALEEIANIAYMLGNGARGLKALIETVMQDIMFSTPKLIVDGGDKTIVITGDYVREKTKEKYKGVTEYKG